MVGSVGYHPPDGVTHIYSMENSSPRRFEYQSVTGVNEHRFKMINLPEIYSKQKREPCFNYDKSFSREDIPRTDLAQLKEPNRQYKVNYNLVQRKPQFVCFTKKVHKDLMKLPEETKEKDKLWDRLLKRAEDERAAEEQKFKEDCKKIGLT